MSKALGPVQKTLSTYAREQTLSTYAREMLAIVHAMKIWQPYLLGHNFTIVTY